MQKNIEETVEQVFDRLMAEQKNYWKIPSRCMWGDIVWTWLPKQWTEQFIEETRGSLGRKIKAKKTRCITKYELTVINLKTGEEKRGFWEDYIGEPIEQHSFVY